MVLVALLLNGLTLVGASDVLGTALAAEDHEDDEPEVVEFEFVEPEQDGELLVRNDAAKGEVPDDTQHIAEADADVEHETRARMQPDSRSSPASTPSPANQAKPSDASPTSDPGEDEAEGEALHDAPDGADAAGKPDLAGLGGSTRALRAAFGTHGTPDDLREVDEGELSILKTRENLYASFFNRMRSRVQEHWDPEGAHNVVDPQRSRFGTSPRTTVLWVQLDAKGAITKVAVIRDSGAEHLDQEAVRAMNAAGPFPNPPDGLIDASGHIEFDFGFTLDFVEGSQRIFRYRG
jgi:TonB family protein